jgi:DUF4097 and DUF4098 domain-containing protein YvlB
MIITPKIRKKHIIKGEKMKKYDFPEASAGFLLYLLIAATGCFCAGCIPRAKYERIVHLSAPLPAGSLFEAQTHNGYITITGADVDDCNLTATITARANTEENAQKLAEEVEVKLIPSGSKLTAKIEKPELAWGKSICVSLDVTVPSQTNADLTTHNGALKIKNLTGQLNGTTHNGEVTAEKISGTAKLKTHNGKIACKEVAGNTQLQTHNGSVICEEASGDIKLRTHNGSAKAFYSTTAPPVCNVSIVTHNGGVSLTAPPNFSAKVDVSTHNGSINTDLPITGTEEVTKSKLTGTIGTGEGELYLETHNGSINIR